MISRHVVSLPACCVRACLLVKRLYQCFSTLVPQRTPCLRKHKETVGGAQRLLQFCQLPDRNFVIFRGIFIILYGISYVLIPLFLSEPVTMFCGTLRFRGTLYEEHWPTCLRVLTSVVLFQHMNQVADFHETWYERSVFRFHPASYVLCYFPL